MSKRIRWLDLAVNDLEGAVEYVAKDNANAARKLASCIYEKVQMLSYSPEIGRPGRIAGTRELVVGGTAYIVAYRISAEEIQILRILHGARRWPAKL